MSAKEEEVYEEVSDEEDCAPPNMTDTSKVCKTDPESITGIEYAKGIAFCGNLDQCYPMFAAEHFPDKKDGVGKEMKYLCPCGRFGSWFYEHVVGDTDRIDKCSASSDIHHNLNGLMKHMLVDKEPEPSCGLGIP